MGTVKTFCCENSRNPHAAARRGRRGRRHVRGGGSAARALRCGQQLPAWRAKNLRCTAGASSAAATGPGRVGNGPPASRLRPLPHAPATPQPSGTVICAARQLHFSVLDEQEGAREVHGAPKAAALHFAHQHAALAQRRAHLRVRPGARSSRRGGRRRRLGGEGGASMMKCANKPRSHFSGGVPPLYFSFEPSSTRPSQPWQRWRPKPATRWKPTTAR